MADDEKGRLWKVGGSLSTAIQTLQAGWSLVEQLGLKPWLVAVVLGSIYAAAAWFWNHVPWYVAGLLFLAVVALCLWIYHRWLLIRATKKWTPRKYRELGRTMVELSQESFRFIAQREHDKADMHRRRPAETAENSHQYWQEDRDFDSITARQFFERFGTRVLGAFALIHQIGAEIPHHMVGWAGYRPDGIPQFLGTVGDLLAKGYITDALDITKDRNYMWNFH